MTVKKNLAIFSAILAGIFWGTSGLFVRLLVSYGMDSFQISCVRLITAAVFMSIFILIKDYKLFYIKLRDLPFFILTGVISIFLLSVTYFKTMTLVSVSVACVLMYTAPIFVLIFSALLFREKLTLKKIVAVFLAVFGCFLVSGIIGSGEKISSAALMFGLLSGISYASYSIFGKYVLKKYSPLTLTVYSFIFAAAASLVFFDFTAASGLLAKNKELFLLFPITGLSTSIIPYLLYSFGLKKLEPSTAVVLSSVEPLVATLVSIFILSEGFTFYSISGIAAIILSIIILN